MSNISRKVLILLLGVSSFLAHSEEQACLEDQLVQDGEIKNSVVSKVRSRFNHMRNEGSEYKYIVSVKDCGYVIFENEIGKNGDIKQHKTVIYKYDMAGEYISLMRMR